MTKAKLISSILVFLVAIEPIVVLSLKGTRVPRNDGSIYLLQEPTPPRNRQEHDGESLESSRRSIFSIMASSIPFCLGISDPANAAAPVTTGETEGLGALAERALLRPNPPKSLRPKLDRDFAVLLMRSSYNALDQIDCVAMDQFQRDFFIIRQSEYEPYTKKLGPGMVQQGDLTDPYYFDFISFAQYATIQREVSRDPPLVFEEQQPVEVPEGSPQKFVATVVKRDPSLANDMLAQKHSSLVGSAILDRLLETFDQTPAAIPRIPDDNKLSSDQMFLASITQVVKLFLINGFAWDGEVTQIKADGQGTQLCISLTSPANLWSGRSLRSRRADPINDYVLKTCREFLRREGYRITKSSVKYEGNQEKTYFTIQ